MGLPHPPYLHVCLFPLSLHFPSLLFSFLSLSNTPPTPQLFLVSQDVSVAMVAFEQAKFGDAGEYPQQAAFTCAPLIHLQRPQEMPSFPTEFCLAPNRDGNNVFVNKEMWEEVQFPREARGSNYFRHFPNELRGSHTHPFQFLASGLCFDVSQSVSTTHFCSVTAPLPTGQENTISQH